MPKIKLYPIVHRNAAQIAVAFEYDEQLKAHLKKLTEVKWSKTLGVYYVLQTQENLEILKNHLADECYEFEETGLQNGLIEVNWERELLKNSLSKEVKKSLWEYVSYLRGKRFGESTVKTYYNFALKFVKFQKKPLNEITNRDVELFIEKEIAGQKYAVSTHRQCISALKHFAELHCYSEIDVSALRRPKKDRLLPTVLSQEQVLDLLRATRNLKHRAVLALIYSSGLRLGELLSLKLSNIDIDRRQILVKQAKGRKDRYVVMADSFIPLLFNYLGTYSPKIYFVEGQNGEVYSASSVRSFLKLACKRARIIKRVTPHTLRHSYATHMLENGIGLRYIQELLGHSKPETTMIYTHVAQKDLMQIVSPLDLAVKKLAKPQENDQNLRLSRDIFR
ncbi:site-specific integrase [Gillisia sp. M10.2A]|uniref:Site-specific integrase n=1 Tax=Gillisia lutea TaxID=2909668 RepID=A0ABS9EE65_9FLAO|nr:tyrosine-type recombinase/integrase [Gillisia lutea]MCF4100065.1 site-specific integrase [Gillisia lutea]